MVLLIIVLAVEPSSIVIVVLDILLLSIMLLLENHMKIPLEPDFILLSKLLPIMLLLSQPSRKISAPRPKSILLLFEKLLKDIVLLLERYNK